MWKNLKLQLRQSIEEGLEGSQRGAKGTEKINEEKKKDVRIRKDSGKFIDGGELKDLLPDTCFCFYLLLQRERWIKSGTCGEEQRFGIATVNRKEIKQFLNHVETPVR